MRMKPSWCKFGTLHMLASIRSQKPECFGLADAKHRITVECSGCAERGQHKSCRIRLRARTLILASLTQICRASTLLILEEEKSTKVRENSHFFPQWSISNKSPSRRRVGRRTVLMSSELASTPIYSVRTFPSRSFPSHHSPLAYSRVLSQ